MGYFSNGSEGDGYFEHYCSRCLHDNEAKEIHCPIWSAHLSDNYKSCNDKTSILRLMIPRSKDDLSNEQCVMFVDRGLLTNLQIEKYEYEALKDRI